MVTLGYYPSVGFALELLSKSKYHAQFLARDYLRNEVLPPLSMSNVKFYLCKDYSPSAMVTWAYVSEAVEAELHATGRTLYFDEWNCGDRVFINDLIAPYQNSRSVIHDIKNNLFPNSRATSIRRNDDASVKKINKWIGVNVLTDTKQRAK